MNIYLTTQFAQQYCCVELTRGFDFCAFSWVRRGANSLVYPLTQISILLFYRIILHIILQDVLGVFGLCFQITIFSF